MEQKSYTIRAACLYRLVKFIYEHLQQLAEKEFTESLNQCDQIAIDKYGIDEYIILTDMYQHMTLNQVALPEFPTKHIDIMGKAVLIIVNWYKTYPSLYQKIKIMSVFYTVIFEYNPIAATSRNLEVQELNDNFHAMAAELSELPEGELHACLITIDIPIMFHKDSQFMSVSIRAKSAVEEQSSTI